MSPLLLCCPHKMKPLLLHQLWGVTCTKNNNSVLRHIPQHKAVRTATTQHSIFQSRRGTARTAEQMINYKCICETQMGQDSKNTKAKLPAWNPNTHSHLALVGYLIRLIQHSACITGKPSTFWAQLRSPPKQQCSLFLEGVLWLAMQTLQETQDPTSLYIDLPVWTAPSWTDTQGKKSP